MCSVRDDSCSFLVERMWEQFPGLHIKYVMCTPLSCFLLQIFIQYFWHCWGKLGIKQFQTVEMQGLVDLALVQLSYWNSSLYKRGKENNFFGIRERQLQIECIPLQSSLSQWYVLIIWNISTFHRYSSFPFSNICDAGSYFDAVELFGSLTGNSLVLPPFPFFFLSSPSSPLPFPLFQSCEESAGFTIIQCSRSQDLQSHTAS